MEVIIAMASVEMERMLANLLQNDLQKNTKQITTPNMSFCVFNYPLFCLENDEPPQQVIHAKLFCMNSFHHHSCETMGYWDQVLFASDASR